MEISNISAGARATEKGTTIVKPGNEMDKNAFLRILTAELSNQDPMNTGDSTQYVAQMAQFSSLEQMANLNTTMSMNAGTSLLGKQVTLNALNSMGEYYSGIVKSVSNKAGQVTLNVEVNDNGTKGTQSFLLSDVSDVQDTADGLDTASEATTSL